MKLPDTISMEPFQQFLNKRFPQDGKRSTNGVVHKLDSTVNVCWKTLTALGKLPHIQLLPFVLDISRSASFKLFILLVNCSVSL